MTRRAPYVVLALVLLVPHVLLGAGASTRHHPGAKAAHDAVLLSSEADLRPRPIPRASRAASRAPDRSPAASRSGDAAALSALEQCVGHYESRGHWRARRSDGHSASGFFGVIDSTWAGYGGYRHAWQAPPAVQRAWFAEAIARYGLARLYDFGPGTTGRLCASAVADGGAS